MKSNLFMAVSLLLLTAYSCNKDQKEGNEMQDVTIADAPLANAAFNDEQQVPVPFQAQDSITQQQKAPQKSLPPTKIDWDKKIIKTATVKLEVKDFSAYNTSIQQKIKKYGGYIAKEENILTDYKSEVQLSIKVPVAEFEGLMSELGGADIKTIERSINTEDVTSQVVDTKARLEAKKQMRLKYLEFLKQSKNMAEVLQVQAEINDIQEEIEAAAGRIQYLSASAAYSTINLSFYQPLPGFEPVNTTPSFTARFVESFKTGADFFKELILGLTTIWPLLLIIAGGIFFWKRSKRIKVVKVPA